MRCQKCNQVCEFKPRLFRGSDLPGCQKCVEKSQARVVNGKQPLTIGRLKPDVLLQGDPHPDDKEIVAAIEDDLTIRLDLVLVVGTKLATPRARSMATRFCHAAQSRGGAAVWISKEKPAKDQDLFRLYTQGGLRCGCLALRTVPIPSRPSFRTNTHNVHQPHSPPLVELSTRCRVTVPPTLLPPVHRLSVQQLGTYNDILTDTLVDHVSSFPIDKTRHELALIFIQISYGGVIRQYYSTYYSTYRDQQSIISILRDFVIQKKDLPRAEHRLLALPNLKTFFDNLTSRAEKKDFQQYIRRYLGLYVPDCAFEISSTNRYTITTHKAAIISRIPIRRGKEIKYLCGIRAILTAEEEDDLD